MSNTRLATKSYQGILECSHYAIGFFVRDRTMASLETVLDIIGKFPTIELQERAQHLVFANKQEQMFESEYRWLKFFDPERHGALLPATPDFLRQYYLAELGAWMVLKTYVYSQYEKNEADDRFADVFNPIVEDNKRTLPAVRVAAWLCTDEKWRWSKFIKGVPNDLAYGLVLKYPAEVLLYSAFLLIPERRDELMRLVGVTPEDRREVNNRLDAHVEQELKRVSERDR